MLQVLRYRQTKGGSQQRTGLRGRRTFLPQVFRVARASCGRMRACVAPRAEEGWNSNEEARDFCDDGRRDALRRGLRQQGGGQADRKSGGGAGGGGEGGVDRRARVRRVL